MMPSMSCLRTCAGVWLAGGLALAGCGKTASQAPAPARSEPAPEAPAPPAAEPAPVRTAVVGPQITFESSMLEFGHVADTKKVTKDFTFTNTGDETLVIKNIATSCRCTVAELARQEVPAGESEAMAVEFDPVGRVGDTTKSVTIISNAQAQPVLRLLVHATVEPMLRYERYHKLGVIPLGQENRSVVELNYDDPDLELRDLTVNSPYLAARLLRLGDPGPVVDGVQTYTGEIEITVSPEMPWGIIYDNRAQFTIHGRPAPQADPIDLVYRIYVTGEVYGQLQAEPSAIAFGTLPAGQPYERALTLTRTMEQPFTVLGTEVSECELPGVQVRVEPVSPWQYRLVINGVASGFRGGFRGVVTITTDVPGEESVSIRFAGVVG
jgi:hypothetical protein